MRNDDNSLLNNFSSHTNDLTFGFNDSRFSDHVLIIEILTEPEQNSDLHNAENGVEAWHGTDSGVSEQCSIVSKYHVNSLLLASKSTYFHKLFSNGMMESQQRSITLRIDASEVPAVMELLNYMYGGRLTAITAPALLDVLKAADKFQVVSCMKLCTSLLMQLPMSTESALLYLDFASGLPMAVEVRHLADVAKQFLAARFKDIEKVWNEIMEMPLAGIEAILLSDVLQVSTEDKLFDLALKWTVAHYPKLEDQRKILSERLGPQIRFPYMSPEKLKEVLRCNIFEDDFAYKAVVYALFLKINSPPAINVLAKRAYQWRPVKVVEFEYPSQDLVVYFDLTLDECAKLNPSDIISSESFNLVGRPFYLYAQRFGEDAASSNFSVCLAWESAVSLPLAFAFEFAFRSKLTRRFVLMGSSYYTLADEHRCSVILYSTPWSDFMDGVSLDFINEVLHLEVTFRTMQ